MKVSAIQFFHTLDAATKADVDLTLQALKNHFCNPNFRELHQLKLENLKFKHKEEQPKKFLVKLQNLALHAFPDPISLPVIPAASTDAAEIARKAAEHQANRDRQRFPE